MFFRTSVCDELTPDSVQRLGKNPEDYPDKKGQPHVQVALRLKAKGGSGKAGDVIPYVFCLGADGKTSRSAQADRAFHPDEFRRKDSGLKIGGPLCYESRNEVQRPLPQTTTSTCPTKSLPSLSDYAKISKGPIVRVWLSVWVSLPPLVLVGAMGSKLEDCPGLDPTKFQNASVANVVEKDYVTFASQLSDQDRFREAAPLPVRCKACKAEVVFRPLLEDQNQVGRID